MCVWWHRGHNENVNASNLQVGDMSLAPAHGPTPQPQHPGTINTHSAAQRARREHERQQQLLSAGDNVPPTPPPSNRRSRLGEYKSGSSKVNKK